MSKAKHRGKASRSTKRHDWFNLAVAGVSRVILLAAASMLLWAIIPAALGWHVTTTMSGSMEPKVMTGDVVVSMPIDGNKVIPGQVILAPDPAKPDHLRFHRVLKPGDNGTVITKGDNNPQADSDPIKRKDIVGVGVLRIPTLGLPALWMNQHQWLPLGVAFVGLPLLFLLSGRDRYLRQQLELARREEAVAQGKNPDPAFVRLVKRATPKRLHSYAPQTKAAASMALVLILIGSAVTLRGSESGFSSIDENPGNVTGTPTTWSCWNPATGTTSGIYYNFNDSYAGADLVGNAASATNNGIITGAANTKTASNCTSTNGSPYLNLDGSSTSRLYSDVSAGSTRNYGVSIAFKTSTASATTLVALTDTRGNNTATNTAASIVMDTDGTISLRVTYENTSGAQVCQTFSPNTVLNDNKWHYASVSRIATSSYQRVIYWVDGSLGSSISSNDTAGTALKMKPSSTTTFNGYVRAGYSQGSSGSCSDTTHTTRFKGAVDEIASPDYDLQKPGLH